MSVRGVLSLCLYHAGDHVCEVLINKDVNIMWLHKLYGNLMLMSHRLDNHDEVWNTPDDEVTSYDQSHYEDEQIHQI